MSIYIQCQLGCFSLLLVMFVDRVLMGFLVFVTQRRVGTCWDKIPSTNLLPLLQFIQVFLKDFCILFLDGMVEYAVICKQWLWLLLIRNLAGVNTCTKLGLFSLCDHVLSHLVRERCLYVLDPMKTGKHIIRQHS